MSDGLFWALEEMLFDKFDILFFSGTSLNGDSNGDSNR